MNFLPYGGGGTGGWVGAFGASAVAHAAIITGMVGVYNQTLELADLQNQQAAFDVSVALEEVLKGELEGTDEVDETAEPDPKIIEADAVIGNDEIADVAEADDELIAETEIEESVVESVTDDFVEDAGTEEVLEAVPDAIEPDVIEDAPPEAVEPDVIEDAPPEVIEPDVVEDTPPEVIEPDAVEDAPPEEVEIVEDLADPLEDETTAEDVVDPIDEVADAPVEDVVDAPVVEDPPPPVEDVVAALDPIVPDPVGASPFADDGPDDLGPITDDASGLLAVATPDVGFGGDTGFDTTADDSIDTSADDSIVTTAPAAPDIAAVDVTPPEPVEQDIVTAAVDSVEGAPAEPATGEPAPLTASAQAATRPPTPQEIALSALIGEVRDAPSEPCLAALPRRDGAEGVGLALVSDDASEMETFSETLAAEIDQTGLRQTRALVDSRQCAAVDFVRLNADYPATRLGLRLDADTVESGGNLTGVVRSAEGRDLVIFLVDDNGVVQDLGRFTAQSGDFHRFDVPVTREGEARDTRAILMALSYAGDASELRSRAGQLAQDVFTGLPDALASGADMAVATVDVR